jgi:hypothetical protein
MKMQRCHSTRTCWDQEWAMAIFSLLCEDQEQR